MCDGVLIDFGYPHAHEDDAERAVRAGLAVVEAVHRVLAPELLQVRVGLATGLAERDNGSSHRSRNRNGRESSRDRQGRGRVHASHICRPMVPLVKHRTAMCSRASNSTSFVGIGCDLDEIPKAFDIVRRP
jgi:hypothetical protein